MNRLLFAVGVTVLAQAACAVTPVTVESLLNEMCDREVVTRRDETPSRMRLWSSHNPANVAPDLPGWFENFDYGNFVRDETNADGRVEHVLVDAKGSGAIVRCWFGGEGTVEAVLRFYVDGNSEPVIEGRCCDLVDGARLCGAPLTVSVATNMPWLVRARNIYLPIPYASSCRVTAELSPEQAKKKTKEGRWLYWHNIETRTWPFGTPVEGLTRERLAKARPAIERANAILSNVDEPVPAGEKQAWQGAIPAGETRALRCSGCGAVRFLRIRLDVPPRDSTQTNAVADVLRDLEIALSFDGETTVKMPVGMFFNTGYWGFEPHATRFGRVTSDGVLEVRWVMPFARNCEMRLANRGARTHVVREALLVKGAYDWQSGRSMHFGADWRSHGRLASQIDGKHNLRDLELDNVTGLGKVVGTSVALVSFTRGNWWGEGDERVYVDGERRPSYIGTGSEDHFGYAYGRDDPFSTPLFAQPIGTGNHGDGHTVDFRARLLDAIPFDRSVKYDLELWMCGHGLVEMSTVSWHYRVPAS